MKKFDKKSNKKQIKNKLIVIQPCLNYIHKLINSLIISELLKKFDIN